MKFKKRSPDDPIYKEAEAFAKAQAQLKTAIENTALIQWIKNNPIKARIIAIVCALIVLTLIIIE